MGIACNFPYKTQFPRLLRAAQLAVAVRKDSNALDRGTDAAVLDQIFRLTAEANRAGLKCKMTDRVHLAALGTEFYHLNKLFKEYLIRPLIMMHAERGVE